MPKQIIVLSGSVSVGKSTLAKNLEKDYGFRTFKSRSRLKSLYPEEKPERGTYQTIGEKLDKKTRGQWVCDGLQDYLMENEYDDEDVVIVDAVRIKSQIDCIRKAFAHKVIHVHLEAPEGELKARYENRPHDGIEEFKTYEQVEENETERKVTSLAKTADVVIDTKRCTPRDVAIKTACQLGHYGRQYLRLVDVLVGGQYGSEGKGHIASYLAKDYDILVLVGGPNAGHTVYSSPDSITFHHLPSGTISCPHGLLVIGPGATVYVPKLLEEISSLRIECDRLTIDPNTMVISDQDKKNEKSLIEKIGSTGQGVGYAAARRISGRKPGKTKLARDVKELRPYIRESHEVFENAYRNGHKLFLEGTQGTGLSLYHGSYPYVTSRDTTVAGCLAEAGISPTRIRKVVMVCRTYPIRVQNPPDGTSGPMSQEIDWWIVEERAKFSKDSIKQNERTSTTNRERRVSEFDWALLRKAASLNAPTDIALSFVDYLAKKNQNARRFEQLDKETIRFIEEVEKVASAPVSLISTRFSHGNRSIIDRRAW